MKNKLIDLNNALFAQLERLSEEDISDEKLKSEISRAQAITSIGNVIVSNAALALKAQEKFGGMKGTPEMLGIGDAAK